MYKSLKRERQNRIKQPEFSQKPKNFHLYKKVYHDSKSLGLKYLPARVFQQEVSDFCESFWGICDEAR